VQAGDETGKQSPGGGGDFHDREIVYRSLVTSMVAGEFFTATVIKADQAVISRKKARTT
jgi:hypothetical protein